MRIPLTVGSSNDPNFPENDKNRIYLYIKSSPTHYKKDEPPQWKTSTWEGAVNKEQDGEEKLTLPFKHFI